MDKEERAKRLRKAFKAAGGVPYPKLQRATTGKTKPIPNKGSGQPLALHFGISLID
jgi:hypothetical protein